MARREAEEAQAVALWCTLGQARCSKEGREEGREAALFVCDHGADGRPFLPPNLCLLVDPFSPLPLS